MFYHDNLAVILSVIFVFFGPQKLKVEAQSKLVAFVSGPQYPTLLRQLIVQGLIKIEEPVVELQVRAEDKNIVTKVVCIHSYSHNYDPNTLSLLYLSAARSPR